MNTSSAFMTVPTLDSRHDAPDTLIRSVMNRWERRYFPLFILNLSFFAQGREIPRIEEEVREFGHLISPPPPFNQFTASELYEVRSVLSEWVNNRPSDRIQRDIWTCPNTESDNYIRQIVREYIGPTDTYTRVAAIFISRSDWSPFLKAAATTQATQWGVFVKLPPQEDGFCIDVMFALGSALYDASSSMHEDRMKAIQSKLGELKNKRLESRLRWEMGESLVRRLLILAPQDVKQDATGRDETTSKIIVQFVDILKQSGLGLNDKKITDIANEFFSIITSPMLENGYDNNGWTEHPLLGSFNTVTVALANNKIIEDTFITDRILDLLSFTPTCDSSACNEPACDCDEPSDSRARFRRVAHWLAKGGTHRHFQGWEDKKDDERRRLFTNLFQSRNLYEFEPGTASQGADNHIRRTKHLRAILDGMQVIAPCPCRQDSFLAWERGESEGEGYLHRLINEATRLTAAGVDDAVLKNYLGMWAEKGETPSAIQSYLKLEEEFGRGAGGFLASGFAGVMAHEQEVRRRIEELRYIRGESRKPTIFDMWGSNSPSACSCSTGEAERSWEKRAEKRHDRCKRKRQKHKRRQARGKRKGGK